MMRIHRLTFISIIQVLSLHEAYDFSCPVQAHWKLRAISKCASQINYSCLFDVNLQVNVYRDKCIRPRIVGPGYKYVFQPNPNRDSCGFSRYQPFIFNTTGYSDCVFLKSHCNSDGQTTHKNGTTRSDKTCTCEARKGYMFVNDPLNKRYCNPTSEDCSCYIGINPNNITDFECSNEINMRNLRRDLLNTTHSFESMQFSNYKYNLAGLPTSKYRTSAAVHVLILSLSYLLVVLGLYILQRYILNRCQLNKRNYNNKYMTSSNEIKQKTDWCTNADSQKKEKCTDARLSPKRSTTSPNEQIKELRILFELVEDMLRSPVFDEDLQNELIKAYPNYRTILLTAKRDLQRNDCEIVVVGNTSAGKSTLINQLIGKKILATGDLTSTGTITRIRDSEKMKIKCYAKDETIKKDKEVQNVKQLKSIIGKLTNIMEFSWDSQDKYFVDVYLPVPILKGNAILVDTPAIGENDRLDNILLDYLPHAVSFVIVVNAFNNGGIHGNRLIKVLTTIMNNREKMPCFDPRDVLFLTNQWDAIQNDDFSSEEDDDYFRDKDGVHTQLWKYIQRKIEKCWCPFDVENVFRVSLKQVGKGNDNYFTFEYKRFETRLQETIEKNKNKRVEYYFRFLKDFVRNAERSTLARLQMLMKFKEQQGVKQQNFLRIRDLQMQCMEASKKLERYKNTIITELTLNLCHYLTSPFGQENILNPSASELPYSLECKEVPAHLKREINRWCKGQEVKTIIDDAKSKIRLHVICISSQLQEFEVDMTETDQSVLNSLNGDLNLLELLPLHSASVFPVAKSVISLACFSHISMSVLEEQFENSFGIDYCKVISSIFYESLPNILNSLIATNERLLDTHTDIKQKQESFVRLGDKITKIQEATKDFEKNY